MDKNNSDDEEPLVSMRIYSYAKDEELPYLFEGTIEKGKWNLEEKRKCDLLSHK
jgi:hypothetical protein